MADPYSSLISSGLQVAQGAASGVGGLVSAYQDGDQVDRNWERLQALKRREELGLLGLTEEEKQAIYGRLNNQTQAELRVGRDARDRALGGYMGQGAAAYLPLAIAAETRGAAIQTGIGATISDVDRTQAEMQRQEIEDRMAYDTAQKQAKVAAWTNFLTLGLASANSAVQQNIKQGAYDSAPADQIDTEALQALMKDDEMFQYMQGLGE